MSMLCGIGFTMRPFHRQSRLRRPAPYRRGEDRRARGIAAIGHDRLSVLRLAAKISFGAPAAGIGDGRRAIPCRCGTEAQRRETNLVSRDSASGPYRAAMRWTSLALTAILLSGPAVAQATGPRLLRDGREDAGVAGVGTPAISPTTHVTPTPRPASS